METHAQPCVTHVNGIHSRFMEQSFEYEIFFLDEYRSDPHLMRECFYFDGSIKEKLLFDNIKIRHVSDNEQPINKYL